MEKVTPVNAMRTELYDFVKESLGKGAERQAIREALLSARWKPEEVNNALSAFAEIDFPVPVPLPRPYLQAQEAFFYIVSFIALYVSAFSLGVLAFVFIERAFPDPLFLRGEFYTAGLTRAISAIVIAFPLYLGLMWRISKAAAADPERRESRIRKWLTYSTLVVGAGIIIGDLIAILAGLLEGELTARFALKGLTILAITGTIFGYYLWDLRREEREEQR